MKYTGYRAMFVLVSGLLLSFPAAAAKHPVPLPKDVQDKDCLECHKEKTEGKSVHSAMALGCLQCHEVRISNDVTWIKLTATTPVGLCVGCHGEKNASTVTGRIHPPAVRDCVKCHDPHSSENQNHLLKPTTGGKQENLCLSCHDIGVDVPQGGSRHAALDMGCDTCHVIHKTGNPQQAEFAYHLTKSTPQLCLDCHDAKDESLQKAHDNQPFASADCLQCHDPHQSSRPMLMQAFLHQPFEGGKGSCSTCHEPSKEGKVVLTAASAKELCITCHSDVAEQIKNAKVQHPGAAGDCTDCHNPHASSQPRLPKTDAVNICLGCHSDIADLGKKRYLHQPAFKQGCAICHEPHGGSNLHLLRAANPNPLCLECHGPDAKPQKLESEHLVAIFGGRVKLPQNYFANVPVLPIKYGLGHPVERHPVVDQMDPSNPDKVRVTINCSTCHQPHASAQPNLLVKDQTANSAFCDTCHKKIGVQP